MFEAQNVWSYVLGAYGVTWLALLGYAVRLYILNRRAMAQSAATGGGG